MLELLTIVVFVWLLVKTIGLALRLTWGAAKIVASILLGLALPALVVCVILAGGVALLIPVVMVGVAGLIVKACL